MLPLFNLTILLNQSKDYRRFGLVLHGLTLAAMVAVHYSWSSVFVVLCLFIWPIFTIIFHGKPYPNLQALSHDHRGWILQWVDGHQIDYEKMQILLDAGIFMLLALKSVGRKKVIVIFQDQMTDDERRALHRIEKILR